MPTECEVLPPPHVTRPGRPKKIRIRDESEAPKKGNRQCTKCSATGHNSRTCERRKQQVRVNEKKKNKGMYQLVVSS